MSFIDTLISLGQQPLAWMCFFLGMAVVSLICLIILSMRAIGERRQAAHEFRMGIIGRQIELQRAQDDQAHALRWHRRTKLVSLGGNIKFPAPTSWYR